MDLADKVRIGIIGTGSISQVHIDAYLKNPAVEIVGCVISTKSGLSPLVPGRWIIALPMPMICSNWSWTG